LIFPTGAVPLFSETIIPLKKAVDLRRYFGHKNRIFKKIAKF
jgi:hypothetical protein